MKSFELDNLLDTVNSLYSAVTMLDSTGFNIWERHAPIILSYLARKDVDSTEYYIDLLIKDMMTESENLTWFKKSQKDEFDNLMMIITS